MALLDIHDDDGGSAGDAVGRTAVSGGNDGRRPMGVGMRRGERGGGQGGGRERDFS